MQLIVLAATAAIVALVAFPLVRILLNRPHFAIYVLLLATIAPVKQLFSNPRAYLLPDLVLLGVSLLILVPAVLKRWFHIDLTGRFLLLFVIANGIGLVHTASYGINREFLAVGYTFAQLVGMLVLYLAAFHAVRRYLPLEGVHTALTVIGLLVSPYVLYEYFSLVGRIPASELETRQFYDAYYVTLNEAQLDSGATSLLTWMGGTNGRARYALMLLAFLIAFGTKFRSRFYVLAFITSTALLGASIIVQFSRGSALTLLVAAGVLVLRQPALRVSGLFRAAVVVGGATAFALGFWANPGAQSKLQTLTGGASSRMVLVTEGLGAFSESWFMGKGFERSLSNTGGFGRFPTLARGTGIHNVYIETLLDAGVLGLVTLLATLGSLGFAALRFAKRPGSERRLGEGLFLLALVTTMSFFMADAMMKNVAPLGLIWILAGVMGGAAHWPRTSSGGSDSRSASVQAATYITP
jgi:O-antigen ligase